jgi:surface protein
MCFVKSDTQFFFLLQFAKSNMFTGTGIGNWNVSNREGSLLDDEEIVESGGATSSFTESSSDLIDLERGDKWPTALTATLVADVALKDDERERVIEETKQALTANAAAAEVIDLDAMINEKVVGIPKKRQRRLFAFACLAFVIAIVAVIVAITLAVATNDPTPFPTSTPTASPAPTPFVNGHSAFQSRDELVQAVDLYMVALSEGSAENSSVAQRYGFPIRNWDVSRVDDFRLVFDFTRHYDTRLDFEKQNPVYRSFDEDLEGWDGKTSCQACYWDLSLTLAPVSNANTMAEMFAGATKFQGRGLSAWKVGNVVDFSYMFAGNTNLKENLGDWNTTSATMMEGMFWRARFHDGIANWDISNVSPR